MKYFNGITDLLQAKISYRKLAKQLHPDMGGTVIEFQKMQEEYKELLKQLQQISSLDVKIQKSPSPESEILNELGKLTKALIKIQVSQNYLSQKIKMTNPTIIKGLFTDIKCFLDRL
ncbi:MAG: hypothetical protein PF484_12890 [Bacteroidales bacterium]|jgi:hypothetical protein|nr:hypothetical protein [Bacteroidales bacterium]